MSLASIRRSTDEGEEDGDEDGDGDGVASVDVLRKVGGARHFTILLSQLPCVSAYSFSLPIPCQRSGGRRCPSRPVEWLKVAHHAHGSVDECNGSVDECNGSVDECNGSITLSRTATEYFLSSGWEGARLSGGAATARKGRGGGRKENTMQVPSSP